MLVPVVLLALTALGAHLRAPWRLAGLLAPTAISDGVDEQVTAAQRSWAVLGTFLMAATGLAALLPLLAIPQNISGATQFRGLGLMQLPQGALALAIVLAGLTFADLFGLMTWRRLARAEYRMLACFGMLGLLVAGFAWNDLALRLPPDETVTTEFDGGELVVRNNQPNGPPLARTAIRTVALLPPALASGGLALALLWPGQRPTSSEKVLGFLAAGGIVLWLLTLPAFLRSALTAQLDILTFVSAAALYAMASFLPARYRGFGLLAATAFLALALTRTSALLLSLAF